MEEITIYEKDTIKITNLRAIFEAKTYSVSNITAVEIKRIDPSSCLPIGLLMVGVIAVIGGVMDLRENASWLIVGVVCIGLFILVNKASKPSWAVSLTTSSGEVKAYVSQNEQTIKQIVEALNNSIVQKG